MRNTNNRSSAGIAGQSNHSNLTPPTEPQGTSPPALPTQREMEVLQLLCAGLTTKEIAAELGIAFKTAACHRERLLGKAGVHGSVALFRWALTSGLVSLSDQNNGHTA
jgi:DNA-binding NarL/FixJ family response regulator